MNTFGFIIIRHINSEITNKYWNHSVQLIRTFYPFKKIVIIDDNSKQEFVKSEFDYKNIEIVESEFHGRGELLPYYYYLKNKYFDNAVIIHDSVFFHNRIPFELLNNIDILPFWHFNPDTENLTNTLNIARHLSNYDYIYDKLQLKNNVLGFRNKEWYGCFGVQTYINHSFLVRINEKYNIINLLNFVKTRPDRCCLERIIGCIFSVETTNSYKKKSLFGDIMKYQKWGLSFEQYINKFKNGEIDKNVMKVWTGR
jgi:hypothetical protein